MNEHFADLVAEIRAGRCVAFVGAGFSVPTVPPWRDLLLRVAETMRGSTFADAARKRLDSARSAHDLESFAQSLADSDPRAFLDALRTHAHGRTPNAINTRRRDLLTEIPFASVLTTNFDAILPGTSATRERYREVLRGADAAWMAEQHWHGGEIEAVRLHGSLDAQPILTRRDYRQRLYRDPAYLTFLRALFATRTVLYLGFSFTDAYLNELRSEILALMEHGKKHAPIAFAIVADADAETVRYYRETEGIGLIPYSSADNHAEFDKLLTKLHAQTNAKRRLGELLSGKRIVWVDPSTRNNEYGRTFLESAAKDAENPCEIVQAQSVEEALPMLASGGVDLVLTHFGYQHGAASSSERLLLAMRERDIRAPVIVFASSAFAEHNRRVALSLGAFAYEHQWSKLFREIERLFAG